MATRIIPYLAAALLMTCISHVAFADVCPASECDYGDPQYQAAIKVWNAAINAYANCVNPLVDQYIHAMNVEAILYPRFGIAWRALQDETKAVYQDNRPANDTANSVAIQKAQQQFVDRILRTAEPEMLDLYNLMHLKFEQRLQACGSGPGAAPEPPRK